MGGSDLGSDLVHFDPQNEILPDQGSVKCQKRLFWLSGCWDPPEDVVLKGVNGTFGWVLTVLVVFDCF